MDIANLTELPERAVEQVSEARWASGPLIQVCVACEFDPEPTMAVKEAVTVYASMALCRSHLLDAAKGVLAGYTRGEVLKDCVDRGEGIFR